jgi:hypothetical protein
LLNEELDCLMEVSFQAAILRGWYWHRCIDRLWEVHMKHLFLGCFVVALEHILKLHTTKESDQLGSHFSAPLLNLGIVLSIVAVGFCAT